MNKDGQNVTQTEDKQAFRKFVIIMIVSTLAGLLLGIGTAKVPAHMGEALLQNVETMFRIITPYAAGTLTIIGAVIVAILFTKGKRSYQEWDGENEETMERIESLLSYGLYVSNLTMIATFFFTVAGIAFLDFNSIEKGQLPVARILLWFGSLFLNQVVVIVSQKKIIDLLKEMNPEKKGSIYDPNFMKKWQGSCDEAELVTIYKCGYKAYTSVNMACLVLWFICLVGATLWDFGVIPVAMVSIIWLVSITSCTMEERRLSKGKK